MAKIKLTYEEIIATLKNSELDCVFIEGKDDKIVFDVINEQLENEDIFIDFFPCDGRNNLLKIYDEHHSFNFKTLFFCDSDMWLFNKYRPDLCSKDKVESENFLTTKGYSIENDLFVEYEESLFKMMTKEECELFEKLLVKLSKWFAYQIHLYLNNDACSYSDKSVCNTNFIDNDCNILDENYAQFNFKSINSSLIDDFGINYKSFVRGKIIFEIFQFIFRKRVKEKAGSVTYNTKQLFDICTRNLINEPNSFVNSYIKKINEYFDYKYS